jgi:hypothetical protein
VADLDRIDANGATKKPKLLERKELANLWQDLADEDASKSYRAFWELVGGRKNSTAFLKDKIMPAAIGDAESKQVQGWIRELSSGSFAAREKATAELRKRADSLALILETELKTDLPVEARRRIEGILADLPSRDRETQRRALADRILKFSAEIDRAK